MMRLFLRSARRLSGALSDDASYGRRSRGRALALASASALTLAALGGCGGGDKPAAERPEAGDDMDEDRGSYRRSQAPDIGEDDSDDGLAVEGLRGRLDNYDIQEGVQPHAGALDACFSSYRKAGKRRYLGGRIELAYVVAKDGSVDSVHTLKSDLGAWPVERCLLEVAREMSFARPKGGAAAEFTLPLEFTAQRAPVTLEGDEGSAALAVAGEDALQALADCAEQGEVPERTAVTLYAGLRGAVQSVGFATPEGPADATWLDCAEQAVMGWTVADPKGKITRMTFEFSREAP